MADLRAAAPWWRVGTERAAASLVLVGVLGAAAGAAAFLLRRRARPVPPDRRVPYVVGAALMGPAMFVATGVLFGLGQADAGLLLSSLIMLSPWSVLVAAMMAGWQWQLSDPNRGGRLVSAVVATVVVSLSTRSPPRSSS